MNVAEMKEISVLSGSGNTEDILERLRFFVPSRKCLNLSGFSKTKQSEFVLFTHHLYGGISEVNKRR